MTERNAVAAKITYRQLNQVLTTLGFVRTQTEEFTAYRDAAHDALIVLPVMGARTVVGDPHLVAVRNTLLGKGVASPAEVDALLRPGQNRSAEGDGLRSPAKRQRRSHKAVPQAAVNVSP